MMDALLNALLVAVLALNLYALGSSHIMTVIRIVAAQGILIGVMPLLAHKGGGLPAIGIALAAVFLKGVTIPGMLAKAMHNTSIKKEVEPLIGFVPSLLLGAIATVFAILFARELPLLPEHADALLVPTSFTTVLTGFILLTTRFKAITQIIGYLILENGIFIFGLLLVESMPLVVELGVLLDLFVGIFVICIIINHINRAFDSLDTRHLVELKE